MVRTLWKMLKGDDYLNNFAVKLSSPTSVDITITKKCNHKCIHCYNVWRADDNDNKDLVKALTNEQISIIKNELVLNQVWRATLTGGEPLAEINVLYKLIEALLQVGIRLGMNSNLSLMTSDIANTLVNRYNWKEMILTSLPGLSANVCDRITQMTGSFYRIINGIDICHQYGIPVGINIVVSKKNLRDIELLPEFLSNYKVGYVSITRAIAPLYDRSNKDFFLSAEEIIYLADILADIHEKFFIPVGSITPFPLCILKDITKYKDIVSASCAAGITRCSIDAISGDISACTHEDKSYGNIYKDGLKKAWDNMFEWQNGLLINEECRGCEKLAFCGAECRMIAGTESNVKYNLNKNAKINYQPYGKIKELTKNTLFGVSKDVRYRREDFGGVLRCRENECYVSSRVILLYEIIKDFDTIRVKDFFEFCQENEYLYDVIRELEKMKILYRIEEST